jgi:hypothetical protein
MSPPGDLNSRLLFADISEAVGWRYVEFSPPISNKDPTITRDEPMSASHRHSDPALGEISADRALSCRLRCLPLDHKIEPARHQNAVHYVVETGVSVESE